MLANIPQNRLILYIVILGLLPVLVAAINFYGDNTSIDEALDHLTHVQNLATLTERKQALNMAVKEHFTDADHFYIDKNLETLSFLKPEIEQLQVLVNNKYFAGDENVKKRLEQLTGPANT